MPLLLAAVFLEHDDAPVELLVESSARGSSCKATATEVVQACGELRQPAFVIQQGLFAFSVIRGEFTYLVVSDAYERELPFGFLESLRSAFEDRYRTRKAGMTDWKYNRLQRHRHADCIQSRFGPKVQELLEHYNANPDELSRLVQVRGKVKQVRTQTQHNLEQIMLRGERLSRLRQVSEDLETEALRYSKKSRKLRLERWWASTKSRVMVIGGGSTAVAAAIAIPLLIILL